MKKRSDFRAKWILAAMGFVALQGFGVHAQGGTSESESSGQRIDITEQSGSIGGMVGPTFVDEGVGAGLGFSLDGAYYFNESWGAGIFLLGGNHPDQVTSFFLGAQALYRTQDVLPGLQFGAILGRGRFSFPEGGVIVQGRNALTLGLKVAYDIPISDEYPVTMGIQASIMNLKPGEECVGGCPWLTVIPPMVSAKWWL